MNLLAIFKKKVPYEPGLTASQGTEYLKVFNDDHVPSEYQDNKNVEAEIDAQVNDGITYFIGDIYDRTCIAFEKVAEVTRKIIRLKEKFGKYYVYGNHEAMGFAESESYVVHQFHSSGRRVLLTHGDLESDPVKWKKYRGKTPGASKLGLIKTKIFDNFDWVKGNVLYSNLPDGFLERAARKAVDYNCSYYVCGHFHVETERRYKVKTIFNKIVTVIVLPAHNKNRSKVWF